MVGSEGIWRSPEAEQILQKNNNSQTKEKYLHQITQCVDFLFTLKVIMLDSGED